MTDTPRDILFGTDLALTDTGAGFDLGIARGGDLALAAGADNIAQALRLRLLVRKGEMSLLGLPQYGSRLHELLGEPNNQRTRVIAMGHARGAIEQDPRVAKVLDVQADAPPGDRETLRITMQIALIEVATPINLVFDLRLGNR